MKRKFTHLDSAESMFFDRQLEHVKSQTYDTRFPELKARSLFPVDDTAGPGAKTITYRSYTAIGMAKVISNYATDLPRVDLVGEEFTAKVRSIGDAYGYSIQDVRYARQAGVDMETKKARAAKRAAMQLENNIAFFGDSNHGLVGFLNHPNLTDVAIAADGTGSSAAWTAKTPDQIIRDVNALVSEVRDATNGVESPNTLLLPEAQYTYISSTRLTDTGKTIKAFILENNEWIKEILPCYELKGAGSGGSDMMVVYDKNPESIELAVPQDFEQFPVQEVGLEFVVNCHMRCGGILLYRPLSAAKGEGI